MEHSKKPQNFLSDGTTAQMSGEEPAAEIEILDRLACPQCGKSKHLEGYARTADDGSEFWKWKCLTCEHEFRVVDCDPQEEAGSLREKRARKRRSQWRFSWGRR